MALPNFENLVFPGGPLDQRLGVPAPVYDATTEQAPEPDTWQSILEALASVPQPRAPRNFGEGLAFGFGRGLGVAGAQGHARRQKLEASIAERQKARDAANREATKEYRKERAAAGREMGKESRITAQKQADYERDNPTLTKEDVTSLPSEIRPRFAAMIGQPFPRSTLLTLAGREPRAAAAAEPLVLIEGPDGPVYVTRSTALGKAPPKKEPAPKVSTGEQKQALAFYRRGKEAIDTLTGATTGGQSLEDRIASINPALAAYGQRTINLLKGTDRQRYEQAQRAFTQAKLRKESGAAISPAEYESDALTYFAQPGDAPEVVAQKRTARDSVLEGLKFQSGPAYEEFYGAPESTQVTPGTAASRIRPPLSSFERPD